MTDSIILIPTYNEKENIEKIIRAIFDLPKVFHILIIDDGSPDGTASIVKRLQTEFNYKLYLIERAGKQGLGTAYIAGFNWVLAHDYEFCFEMDADFSHPVPKLMELYEACANQGADVAIGSRYVDHVVNVVNWPMSRVIMSYYASKYVRIVTGLKVADTTAGFKCYTRKVLETINLDKIRFKGYAFQIEMKFTTWKFGFNIIEVPIIFTDRTQGSSKMNGGIFNEAVWGVIKMKLRSFFTKYER